MRASAATKAQPKPQPQLHPSRFALAQHKRNIYFITPADGTTLEEVLDPLYWSHVAARLRPTDRVEVHAEDGSFFAELFVREAGRQHARLVPLRVIEFEQLKQEPDRGGFAVQWKGPHLRWCVVRLADNQIVKGECGAKDEAMLWLASNNRS
jgi:hypothetical protein